MHRDLRSLAAQDVALVAARLRRPRLQQDQLREVAPVERQIFNLSARDQLSKNRTSRLQRQLPAVPHLNDLGDFARGERDVGFGLLTDTQFNGDARRFESMFLRSDFVLTEIQTEKGIAPLLIADRFARLASARIAHDNSGSWNWRARSVLDYAGETCAAALSE